MKRIPNVYAVGSELILDNWNTNTEVNINLTCFGVTVPNISGHDESYKSFMSSQAKCTIQKLAVLAILCI